MKFSMKDGGFTTTTAYGKLHISGNEEYGFRPYQLLVSSVAVCSGGVFRSVAEKMRLDVEDIQIEADVTRNEEEANRVEKIHLHFTIKGSGLPENRIEKALEITRKNCSMVRSVEGSIEITESFTLV